VRAATALALLAAGLGCGSHCSPPAATAPPNVILVTIDTLRADHLGCYGNATVRTPHLDRLAAEGALFERCWAQAPITVPSHVSLLTSLPPAEHGVLRNQDRLARPVPSLPESFAQRGYRTAAFVSVNLLAPGARMGRLGRAFAVHEGPRTQQRAEETNARFFRWLRGACGEPFFAWVHYYDPHMPYAPPAPYDRAYYRGDPTAAGHDGMQRVQLNWWFYEVGGLRRHLARHAAEVRRLKRDLALNSAGVRRLLLDPVGLERFASAPAEAARLRARLSALGASVRPRLPLRRGFADWLAEVRDLRFPVAQYAGEVSYVDGAMGELRTEVERLGLAQRTILLVTADHGESLGEHGIWFQHFGVHEPTLRVPLVVWAPGRVPPGRHLRPARGIDVAPTLLALAGLPPVAAMRGHDLFGTPPADAPVTAQSGGGAQAMVVHDGWKLSRTRESVYYVDEFVREAGEVELYDLAADPAEKTNAAGRAPARAAALDRTLRAALAADERALAAAPRDRASPPGRDVQAQLRALGYVE
jgi:arylsulfatase A-like enzyme